MRILVISDSHGDEFSLRYAIECQEEAKMVIFLGDGCRDAVTVSQSFPDRKFVLLKGNCDFACAYPEHSIEHIGGKTLYCTHGSSENVKYTLSELIYRAQSANADIALYGHTHIPVTDYRDGLHIFNPGSTRQGQYGVIDITCAGVVCINMTLNFI